MRKTTERLMAEHEEINVVLNTLFRAVRVEREGKLLGNDFWNDAIDFVRTFSDDYHHAKEEKILFPAYCNNGMDAEYGPVAVMLRDHQQFRHCIELIEESLDEGEEGNIKRWRATGDFIEGLRFHIHKENNILYPMGEEILSLEDENRLMEMFDVAETALGGVATEEHYRMVAQSLEKQVLAAFDRVVDVEAE